MSTIGNFHDYHRLIDRHKRSFNIYHKKEGFRDVDTTRWVNEQWDLPVVIQGAIWFVNYKDLKRYPDFELTTSDMKLITSTNLLNSFVPNLKDKVVFENNDYYIKNIVNQEYYGNFYIIFLEKVQHQI
jgi:hypothetical protein